jgi:CheY-like chemotaxis protein
MVSFSYNNSLNGDHIANAILALPWLGSNRFALNLFLFEFPLARICKVMIHYVEALASKMNCVNTKGIGEMVFVVDDEPMLLELADAILSPLGYEVRTFRDPELALREFPEAHPAVVITDYAMGRMNGMDLIRECRRLNPRQKMILLSGTVDEHVFADAPVKPDQFLTKPYQIQELAERVRSLIA